MGKPLVSIVIPTARRPQFLARAITSSLTSAERAEVLVVPNGPDASWRGVADYFADAPNVHWRPIETPHANAARNHGLRLATGDFVRFLDDDDYLYPAACQAQCKILAASGADVCSGNVDVVRADGRLIRSLSNPETRDFVEAMLTPSRMTHPSGHLYRRSAIVDVWWDESRSIRQDTAWCIDLAVKRELAWIRHTAATGTWVQHAGPRISRGRDPGPEALRQTAELIQNAYRQLEVGGRLTAARRASASDALWSSLQKGLQYDFAYWKGIASIADSFAPSRRPPSAIYRLPGLRSLSPLAVETILIPVRWAFRPVRRGLEELGVNRV